MNLSRGQRGKGRRRSRLWCDGESEREEKCLCSVVGSIGDGLRLVGIIPPVFSRLLWLIFFMVSNDTL